MGLTEVATALKVSESTARRELVRARAHVAKNGRREPALHAYLEHYRGTES